ncbi:FAD-dependent oxidoreductase [Streptomyces sp. NPDC058045]|uniref:FAD-dependent oxidoreductase n=1 Tax=Streptomyces sp. NPDC058045 TaxID=3346311 RepID=UPI0036EB05CB
MSRLRVIVAGAGIGGLALAGMLRRHDAEVTILERADDLRTGLGLTFWPNAAMSLRSFGEDMLDAVRTVAQPFDRARMKTVAGHTVTNIDLSRWLTRYGVAGLGVTHSDLVGALSDVSGVPVRFSAEVVSVTEEGQVTLADGETLNADVVIGADGVGSAVRKAMLPPGKAAPRGPAMAGWQGVALDGGPKFPGFDVVFGPTGVCGILGLAGERTYWFMQAPADAPPDGDGWSDTVKELVRATPGDLMWRDSARDRAPDRNWGRGRVTLLGDAAHPILPTVGQGACLAVEDAGVLAHRLVSLGDPVAALRRYEADRFERVTKTYKRARRLRQMQQLMPAVRNPMVSTVPDGLLGRMFTESAEPIAEFR